MTMSRVQNPLPSWFLEILQTSNSCIQLECAWTDWQYLQYKLYVDCGQVMAKKNNCSTSLFDIIWCHEVTLCIQLLTPWFCSIGVSTCFVLKIAVSSSRSRVYFCWHISQCLSLTLWILLEENTLTRRGLWFQICNVDVSLTSLSLPYHCGNNNVIDVDRLEDTILWYGIHASDFDQNLLY